MRVVADTNVLVSALLWTGAPHDVLVATENRRLHLYTSQPLLDELAGVLSRPKFSARLLARGAAVEDVVAGYARLTHLVLPRTISPIILEDPSDDAVLACAAAAGATYIVSGDAHLLRLKRYESSRIVSPRTLLGLLQ